MNPVKNLFADIPGNLRDELVETMLHSSGFRLERIVSRGHRSPDGFWYDQDEHEWVVLLKGCAVFRFEDQSENIIMNPGNYINIEKHRRHRVEWTDPEQETIWLAIHYQVH
ncbi:MAG: phosphoribosylaminoimidazole carboxylase [Syntrophus sp. (in: bacteria)]|nr:phosphoribosylaminoimidazole carboxylase [Syntrophus sp. (in: bacteria)]